MTKAEFIEWKQPEVALILMLKLATARLEAIREQYSFRWMGTLEWNLKLT